MWRIEIRLAGAGGQGLGLAAVVLAESALACDYEASLIQAYGPEARGGASYADLVIADSAIANPRFEHPTILLVLNQKAWNRFARFPPPEGSITVIDALLVHPAYMIPGLLAFPFEHIAREELREKIAANMVAVGVLGHLLGRIPAAVLERTAELRSPEQFRRTNREAVGRGWQLVTSSPLSGQPVTNRNAGGFYELSTHS
jgi:2-oxoglutarate ferredoxin oxidoreductase subunit gamma